jgi:hypothetical protein
VGVAVKALSPDRLCLKTAAGRLPFETTATLAPPGGPVGQDRAMRAIAFGAKIAQPGYNIFVTGPQGSGKRASIRRALDRMAAAMPPPPDWAYVHNFRSPHMPRALKFAAGQGTAFKAALGEFVDALKAAMPKLFESEDYRKARGAIEDEYRTTVDDALDTLRALAEAQGLALVDRGENQLDFTPQRDGLELSEDEYRSLPKPDRDALAERTNGLRAELQKTMQTIGEMRARTIDRMRTARRKCGG